ncbi:hypothetical protein D3C81_1803830 [compost metagenome]
MIALRRQVIECTGKHQSASTEAMGIHIGGAGNLPHHLQRFNHGASIGIQIP